MLYKDEEYKAHLLADGQIQIADGRIFRAPSTAAECVKHVQADPGWHSWLVVRGGKLVPLREIRAEMVAECGGAERSAASSTLEPSSFEL